MISMIGMGAPAWGATFLKGTVTAGGSAVSGASVYVACNSATANTDRYPTLWGSTDASGQYTMSTDSTYGPCGSYYAGTTGYSCTVSAYPASSTNASSTTNSAFTLDCNATRTENVALTLRDKKIQLTLTAGSSPITSGVNCNCSKQGGSSESITSSSPTAAGVYELAVTAGTYSCGAGCTSSSCDYSGNPSRSVTVGTGDTTVTATLTFQLNTASVAVTVGIAGVGVGINSYSTNASSAATGASSFVSANGQTDASGAVTLKVPPGTYTVSVNPPPGSLYASEQREVTVADAEVKAVSFALKTKSSKLNISVVDENGKAISGANVSGWVQTAPGTGAFDNFWGQTDSSGQYAAAVVTGLTYTVSANYASYSPGGIPTTNICNYNLEGFQTAKAASDPVALKFTFPICDHTLSISVVDSAGKLLTNISGWAEVQPAGQTKTDTYYGGIGATLTNGVGTVQVRAGSKYDVSPSVWDEQYAAGDAVTVTSGVSGGTTVVALSLLPLDASISGQFVDSDAAAVSVGNVNFLNIFAMKGRSNRNCTLTGGSFSCKVSAGKWCLGYSIDPSSGYASTSPGDASSCQTLTAGQAVTKNLTFLRTGKVTVTVLDPIGSALANVWVEAKSTSVVDYGSTHNFFYMGQGCVTGKDGKCTIEVGASQSGTTYYLNVYAPYTILSTNDWSKAEEQKVTVVAGGSAEATLDFGQPDGNANITVTSASSSASSLRMVTRTKAVTGDAVNPVEGVTVDIFSNSGAYATGSTDSSGKVQLSCTKAATWYAVAYKLAGNSLSMSEVTKVTCVGNGASQTLSISQVATLPECQSKSFDAGTAVTLACTDKFSVTFPANSLGSQGTTVTLSLAPSVTPFMANLRPASFYSYSVKAVNTGTGAEIVSLAGNATLSVPYNTDQLKTLDLKAVNLEACYYDPSQGAYKSVSNATIDADSSVVTMSTGHLTDFVVAGNGNLKGLDGTTGGTEPTDKPPTTDQPTDGGSGGSGDSGDSGGCQLIK